MRKESTGSRSESRPEWEQLEDWVRSQVQRLIQELLEEEVTAFLGRAKSALRSDSDNDTGYRNGYGRARRLTLSSGTIQLRRPRVRDTEEQFESRLLPLFVNRTRKIAELIPELYLHGLSEGDFDLALRGLLGEDAPVSASTVARLKSKWNDELAQWRSRPLDDLEVVYMWVDGVYALTATTHDAPESHDGATAFTFELRFSEEPASGFSYTTVRDHAFTVTDGSLNNVRRLEAGKNVWWEITVTPDSDADVSIALNATTDCTAQGAICTSDGGKLSGGLELVVPGPQENSAATGAPTIGRTAQVGETLTANTTGISDADGLANASFTYQWLADDTEIAGATGSTYTLVAADADTGIKVRVSFTDDRGNTESLTTESALIVTAANSPATGAPTISGTAQVGETLTASTSGISDSDGLTSATFTYQWLADDAAISGATGSTYTLVAADSGKAIKVQVSFTDDRGNTESLTSVVTAAVTAVNSPATGAPTISGTAQVGETLTASTSGISDSDGLTSATFTYQWLADDAAISGATGSTYTLVAADSGKAIKVQVSFTDDRGNTESLTSAATTAAALPPLTASAHDVPASHDGSAAFTFELHFSETPNDGFSYKTLRDHAFTATGGEVVKARRLERGKNVRWEITVQPSGNAGVTVALPATTDCSSQGAICTGDGRKLSSALEVTVPGPEASSQLSQQQNSAATGAPAITGTARVGETLTANTTGIADSDGLTRATFAYQWLADDADITDATGSTYTPAAIDAGNAETLTSAATAAVTLPPLTASAHGVPASHDGSAAFTFELRFSEEMPLSYKTLRDHAFTATGGEVVKARRLEKGKNLGWEITVQPSGNADVTVALPATTDCSSQGAICTGDGRMLSNELTFTVNGPGG